MAYGEIGGEKKDQLLKTELIGQGLVHKEVSRENYGGIGSDKLRINMLIGDLNNKDFEISSSKAKDSVVARETLSNQISREVLKGKNVVAGINGDMFSMENGVPIGSHIYDGNILINFKDAAWTKEKPAIVVYEDNKVEIGPVIIKGEFSHKSLEKEIGVVNKEFGRESDFAIFNSNLNSDKTFRLSDSSIRDGAFVVLKGNNIGDKITSGTSYKGVVVGKYDRYEEIAIAEDEVILYQLKDSGAYVKNNIIMGDEISYTFHTSVNEKDRNDIKTLMTSYNWLIKDGKVLSNSELVSMGYESGIIQSKNSRTAIGLTADNKIIALTTDKLSGKFTDSVGITSEECGKLMEEMGAVQAIGLDGGGSAQINIKEEGDMNIKVSNHPSDENERPITNGLLFLSNGQRTTEVGRVIVDKTTTIFTGGQKEFTVKAVDKNNNPINISNRKIEFSAELGTIDNEGKYIAPQKEGKDVVTVKVDGVSSIVEVTVVGVVDDFSFKDGKMMNLKVGEKKDIDLVGYKDGKVIEIPKSSIKFEVPPELGEVNGNVITVKDNIENGFRSNIKATVSGKTKEIMVVVGLTNLTLDNFEEGNIGRYKTNKNFVNSYDLSISTEESKSGNNSLKLSYDYSGWVTGNGAMYAYFNNWESLKAEIMPEKIGMWVYGDGKAPWLRGYLKDGDNKLITINFTQGNINWMGWKYVEVPINKNWKLPLKLYGVYAVETNKTHQGDKNYGGAIYFDDIKFIYDDSEDLIGPKTSMVNINDNIYSSEFEFSANITDDKSGVNHSHQAKRANKSKFYKIAI